MRLCQRFPRPQRPSARTAGAALACTAFLIATACGAVGPRAARAAARGQQRQTTAGQPIAAGPPPSPTGLRDQVSALQRSFDAGRSRLTGLVEEVKLAEGRLAQLESDEAQAERTLALRLITDYESGDNGGAPRSSELIAGLRAARVAVVAEATQLGALSLERPQLTKQVLEAREGLTGAKSTLVAQQRAGASSALPQDVADEPPAKAPAPDLGTIAGPGTQEAGSSLDFPIPSGEVAPPATWSLVGGGVDIAAPGDTRELAVCAGTVVLHGIGGLGPWTPLLRCDRPIDGHDYVYYGDAGPGDWTPLGTPVSAGQTISEVGPGIIGDSTGPDLEIGFADASGAPLGSAGKPDMMKLLQAAYRS
jgi:hypothetical protein